MLGASGQISVLFGAVPRGFNTAGTNKLIKMANAYTSHGLSLLIVNDKKQPIDLRTKAMKNKMQREYEANGGVGELKRGWNLSTTDGKQIEKYITKYRELYDPNSDPNALGGLTRINFGLVPDRSGYVIVDCDTAEENRAFKNWWMDNRGKYDNMFFNADGLKPSVLSPGTIKGGKWVVKTPSYIMDDYGTPLYSPNYYENIGGEIDHKNGGHWYFRIPEGYAFPPSTPAKIVEFYDARDRSKILKTYRKAKHDNNTELINRCESEMKKWGKEPCPDEFKSHFAIVIHSGYVLIPPSSRNEGWYELASGEFQLDKTLANFILAKTKETVLIERNRKEWKANNPRKKSEITESWDSILTRYGWDATGIQNKCGCMVYHAPNSSSQRSGVAHTEGCNVGEFNRGLWVYSDDPSDELRPFISCNQHYFEKDEFIDIMEGKLKPPTMKNK